MLPKGDEYVSAIQHPQIAFQDPDLRMARVETRPTGLPKPYSGAFTITFHLIGGRDWAVRCFTREISEVKQRYDAITRFLRSTSEPLFSRAELLQRGMLVKGQRHDVIKMEWVHGEQLNTYIGRRVRDSAEMTRLAERVLALGARLEELGIAHGDLQHGNILVTPAGELRLVDYDDLYLPELAGLRYSNGIGQENYQHPRRSSSDFNPNLDRFSIFAMHLGLRALAVRPELWDRFNGGDERVLFVKSDYVDPEGSALFRELDATAAVKELVDRFASVCRGPFAAIPSLDDFIDGRFHYERFLPGPVRTRPSVAPPTAASAFTSPPPQVGWQPRSGPQVSYQPSYWQQQRPPQARKRNYMPVVLVALLVILVGYFNAEASHRREHASSAATYEPPRQQTFATRPEAMETEPPVVEPTVAPRTTPPTPTPIPTMSSTPLATNTRSPSNAVADELAQAASNVQQPHRRTMSRGDTQASEALANAASDQAASQPPQQAAAESSGGTCATPMTAARLRVLAQATIPSDVAAIAPGKSVELLVSLNADSTVKNIWIVTSSGNDELDAAAQAAARASSYRPAYQDCSPIDGTVNVKVSF